MDINTKVAEWRRKAAEGTLTLEDNKEIIKHLRAGREAIPQAKAGSAKTKAARGAKPTINSDDLLAGLEDM